MLELIRILQLMKEAILNQEALDNFEVLQNQEITLVGTPERFFEIWANWFFAHIEDGTARVPGFYSRQTAWEKRLSNFYWQT